VISCAACSSGKPKEQEGKIKGKSGRGDLASTEPRRSILTVLGRGQQKGGGLLRDGSAGCCRGFQQARPPLRFEIIKWGQVFGVDRCEQRCGPWGQPKLPHVHRGMMQGCGGGDGWGAWGAAPGQRVEASPGEATASPPRRTEPRPARARVQEAGVRE
jgi:hypothetical protein